MLESFVSFSTYLLNVDVPTNGANNTLCVELSNSPRTVAEDKSAHQAISRKTVINLCVCWIPSRLLKEAALMHWARWRAARGTFAGVELISRRNYNELAMSIGHMAFVDIHFYGIDNMIIPFCLVQTISCTLLYHLNFYTVTTVSWFNKACHSLLVSSTRSWNNSGSF